MKLPYALEKTWRRARRLIPIIDWLPQYRMADLRPDLIAGAISWAVGVPVVMAYAQMAGVPAQAGLYASLAALTVYAIFSTSRHVKVMASSTMAVMSAAVVAPMAEGDAGVYAGLTAALALLVGLLLIGAGAIRLGFISDFLSKSVVTGFVFGLAINIAVGQLPKLFGLPGGSGAIPEQIAALITNLGMTNPWTLALSIGALAIILFLRLRYPQIPSGPVVLVLSILAVSIFSLDERGVSVVGAVPLGLPRPAFPTFPWSQLPYLLVGALGIVFLAVGESLGAARAYAAKQGYSVDPNQELIALGAANVGAGMMQGFTVDASLSQTATAEQSGGRTQVASLVTVALFVLTLLLLAPLFTNLPNAALAAIVINSVISLMDTKELRRYFALRRIDFWLALSALVGVVFTDVLTGLVFAVVLSLVFIVYRASRPYIAPLGRVPGKISDFGDLQRHPEYEQVPGLLIVRMDAPLYFFNANVAHGLIREMAVARPPLQAVLIDIGASSDLDIPTIDMLADVAPKLRSQGVTLMFAQVRGNVRDLLRKTGAMDLIGAENVFVSVAAGVEAYARRFSTPAPVVGEQNGQDEDVSAAELIRG